MTDYVSGELEDPDLSSFEAHLETCESCKSCTDDMLALRSRVRDLLRISAPADLRSRITGLASAGIP